MPKFDLEIRDEDGARRVVLDAQECLRLGRSRENDIVVKASGVSRNHCLLLRGAGGWKLVDLKSSNASFVRGEPVREASLSPGDAIRIGMARLWFLAAGAPAPEGTRIGEAVAAKPAPSRSRRRAGATPPAPGESLALPPSEETRKPPSTKGGRRRS